MAFNVGGDVGVTEDPRVRCRWSVVGFLDLAAVTNLAGEFHDGEEEVGKQSEEAVELFQEMKFFLGVVAVVTDSLADDGVVFFPALAGQPSFLR